jgi:hypothetical protein
MLAKCPYCGASLRRDGADQNPLKCWMCTAPLPDLPEIPQSAMNQTVVLRPLGSRGRAGALKLDENAIVETPSLPENQLIKIAVEEGTQPGTVYDVSRPLMTIGRLGGGADIQVDDPEVSRLHCSIEVRRDSILLQDLRSKNGTFFDGSRIFATRLDQLSRFRIGATVLRVDRIEL